MSSVKVCSYIVRYDVGFAPNPFHGVCSLATCKQDIRKVAQVDDAYGLGAAVIPPFWHRHPELVWELSALHLHWLCVYDPEQNGSAPNGWHRDFADARQRLRDWVSACGTRLDRDRPTRQTAWPGEKPTETIDDTVIPDRAADFRAFVDADVARRQAAEDAFYASLGADPATGEVRDDDEPDQ